MLREIEFAAPKPLSNVIVLDGLIGGGKGMFCDLLSSWPQVGMWAHNSSLEQLLDLTKAKQVTKTAAEAWIQNWVNEWWFNSQIARNSNYNIKDVSSMWFDPKRIRMLRVFKSVDETNQLVERTQHPGNREMLLLMTHGTVQNAEVLFSALGKQLKFIRLKRLTYTEYLIQQTARHIRIWDCDGPRHQRFIMKYNGLAIPNGIEDFDWFVEGNRLDRAIKLLWVERQDGDKLAEIAKTKFFDSYLEIKFEDFLLNPYPQLDEISAFLGSPPNRRTLKRLKALRVPRSDITDAPRSGRASKFYRKIGWTPPSAFKSPEHYAMEAIKFAEKNCELESSVVLLKRLNNLS